MQNTTTGPSVNAKTQDNDAAGGVTISSIATMPPGYDLYTSLTIKDATFYKSEEVYRGQRNVDNQRLLAEAAELVEVRHGADGQP